MMIDVDMTNIAMESERLSKLKSTWDWGPLENFMQINEKQNSGLGFGNCLSKTLLKATQFGVVRNEV